MAEVWVYNGESLVIQQLQNGTYITFPTSRFFPNLPILEIAMFLQQSETLDYLELTSVRVKQMGIKPIPCTRKVFSAGDNKQSNHRGD